LAAIAILVANEILSTVLAFVLVYYFVRAYQLTRSLYLFGLPCGFLLLASSYVFLGVSLLYENNMAVSEMFLWLRLIMQSYGFAFIAFAYYFSSKTNEASERVLRMISLPSVVTIILVFGALYFTPPFLELPPASVADEWFKVLNLVFLGYVIWHLFRHLASPHKEAYGSVWAPLAFSVLALGQYSMLIWGIDGSQIAFIFAHIARLASLTLFIYIYHSSGRVGSESRKA